MKRQPIKWEKLLASHIFDNELMFYIYYIKYIFIQLKQEEYK